MATSSEEGSRQRELGMYRDTVESIGVAIVLAFVLRAFFVEAFVIPTGSMAPRLMGEHWDLTCPTCGYHFSYGWAKGLDDSAAARASRKDRLPPSGAVCPNCRAPYPADKLPEFVNSGDRVLVMKYIYDFHGPEPWDVVVFKNPQDNRDNYIKRLIGLPGETIEIVHGDIFVSNSPDPNVPRHIRRKPPRAQEAMWQIVYDNDFLPDRTQPAAGRAPQWASSRTPWKLDGDDGGRRFPFAGSKEAADITLQTSSGTFSPRYGYNGAKDGDDTVGNDVCTDLKLSAVVMPGQGPSTVTLKLSSFDARFEAEFHGDGKVYLICYSPDLPGSQLILPPATVEPMKSGKGREISLTNVDFRAAVWVDGKMVLETTDEQYPCKVAGEGGFYNWLLRRLEQPVPVPEVRISAKGSPCELRHMALYRDVYYTSTDLYPIAPGPRGDYARELNLAHENPDVARLHHLDLADPRHRAARERARGWATTGKPITLAKNEGDPDLDEFFCLGDNSPSSLDGRSWTAAAPTLRLYGKDGSFQYQLGTVPRYNLLGKAMFVYWPGGFRLPFLNEIPIVPNVGRMRFIR